ncbi:MAG TPA: hypothetical protein VMC41_03600, partial [Candidatus Nanoarchaeia archaeon]|nr:hypothetical protein [Candidatus Nanoarchaeia archaeon]
MLKFSNAEKQIGKKIYKKFIELKKESRAPIIPFDNLYGFLNREEKNLIDKICSANPKDYGKNFTIFFGIKPVPKNLVALAKQKYISIKDNKAETVKTQYLPKPALKKFLKMKQAMRKDLGTTINITSGYRSPAFQAVILFIILFENKWNVKKTLRKVTLPG